MAALRRSEGIVYYPSERETFAPQPLPNLYRPRGSGASADNSLRATAEAPKVTLVREENRLELRHLGLAACAPSIRQGVFAGPESLDAPEPSSGTRVAITCHENGGFSGYGESNYRIADWVGGELSVRNVAAKCIHYELPSANDISYRRGLGATAIG